MYMYTIHTEIQTYMYMYTIHTEIQTTCICIQYIQKYKHICTCLQYIQKYKHTCTCLQYIHHKIICRQKKPTGGKHDMQEQNLFKPFRKSDQFFNNSIWQRDNIPVIFLHDCFSNNIIIVYI